MANRTFAKECELGRKRPEFLSHNRAAFNPHQLKKSREESEADDLVFVRRPLAKKPESMFSISLSDESVKVLSEGQQAEKAPVLQQKKVDVVAPKVVEVKPQSPIRPDEGESDMDVDTPPPTVVNTDRERLAWEAEVRRIKAVARSASSPIPHDPINKLSMYSMSHDFCSSSYWRHSGHVSFSPEPMPDRTEGTSQVRSRSRSPLRPLLVDPIPEEPEDDMFAKTPEAPALEAQQAVRGQADDLIDSDGYFIPQTGETITNPLTRQTYTVLNILGRGVFSCVVKAKSASGQEFAVKIIRDKELMIKAGVKEVRVLQQLNSLDMDDHCHVIRYHESFYLGRHLCIVSESLDMSLRDLAKKHDKGLSLEAVQSYGRQIMKALTLFKRAKLLHCDIKPDNILVTSDLRKVKLCDFGSVLLDRETLDTDEVVARFYRAPEVILGVPLGFGLDMWAVGCSLFELYTGSILFPGRNNAEMLKLIMEVKGLVPKAMRTAGRFSYNYFDAFNFYRPGLTVPISEIRKERDLGVRLNPSISELPAEAETLLTHFRDLLEQSLALDPGNRLTPEAALDHAFLRWVS